MKKMRKLIALAIAFFTLVQFGPSAVFGHERCTPLKSGWSVFGSRHDDHATSYVAALDRMKRQELALTDEIQRSSICQLSGVDRKSLTRSQIDATV